VSDAADVVGPALPSGVVMFVLPDVIGSTRLWSWHGAAMDAALVRHGEVIDAAASGSGGVVPNAR
jgi:hypothetical protein